MWMYFLCAFVEKKIDLNKMPFEILDNANLSNGRVTAEFAKWLVEDYLKLAKNTKIEKDPHVEGQFLVKDHKNNLIFIVRDFVIAEKSTSKDFVKTERIWLNKKAEEEGAQLELIKKTFKKMISKDGLMIKGPGHWKTVLEIENAMYVYPFAENEEMAIPFKKQRIYITVTDVRHQGVRLKELLGHKDAPELLEHVGKALALWHLKTKFVARVSPFDVGFATVIHGDFRPENVLINKENKKITFLNNDQIANVIKGSNNKPGKSNWIDIKTFIKDLNEHQQKAFLKGYASLFKKKGYTADNMEEFIKTNPVFKCLDVSSVKQG